MSEPDGSRRLVGSWLDWTDSYLEPGRVPHFMERQKIIAAVRDLRVVVKDHGPDSVVSHRAQAAFLAAVKPEDLFGLLYVCADSADDNEEAGGADEAQP